MFCSQWFLTMFSYRSVYRSSVIPLRHLRIVSPGFPWILYSASTITAWRAGLKLCLHSALHCCSGMRQRYWTSNSMSFWHSWIPRFLTYMRYAYTHLIFTHDRLIRKFSEVFEWRWSKKVQGGWIRAGCRFTQDHAFHAWLVCSRIRGDHSQTGCPSHWDGCPANKQSQLVHSSVKHLIVFNILNLFIFPWQERLGSESGSVEYRALCRTGPSYSPYHCLWY